jgi:SAM-dependent methyltransferase
MHLAPLAVWRCARLNWRVARLAVGRRWLSRDAFAAGYDRVAPTYDDAWQRYLRPVTDDLLARLPALPEGRILDLGCGTGYAAEILARRHPVAPVAAVDLSPQMLAGARRRVQRRGAEFVQADMLEYLAAQPPGTAALVFSAWAIGYSHPKRLLKEAARVLSPGGSLAFVVNCADTLAPVFRAFRQCMADHPDELRLAAWLHFPKCWASLQQMLVHSGFQVEWHLDGFQPITPPCGANGTVLSWLLKTGVLAGFDAMLPLAEPGPVSRHFEEHLRADPESLLHHYLAVIARRP